MSKRRDDDFYATPEWCVRAIWPHIKYAVDNDGFIIDPSAGDGAIVRALLNIGVPADRVSAVEMNEERREKVRDLGVTVLAGDTLTYTYAKPCLIVMNPPYGQAREHVEHAIKQASPAGAVVAALLRLGFLGSKRRMGFWEKYPADVFVIPERPSFTGDGKVDSSDYAWFVWAPDRGGSWSILDLDGIAPIKRRRRRKSAEMFAKPKDDEAPEVEPVEQAKVTAEEAVAPAPLGAQVLAAMNGAAVEESIEAAVEEPVETVVEAEPLPATPTTWDASPSPLELAVEQRKRQEQAEARERARQAARAAIAARQQADAPVEEEEPAPEPPAQRDLFGASRIIEAAFADNDGVELPDFG